jgi:hypothetical protein
MQPLLSGALRAPFIQRQLTYSDVVTFRKEFVAKLLSESTDQVRGPPAALIGLAGLCPTAFAIARSTPNAPLRRRDVDGQQAMR